MVKIRDSANKGNLFGGVCLRLPNQAEAFLAQLQEASGSYPAEGFQPHIYLLDIFFTMLYQAAVTVY